MTPFVYQPLEARQIRLLELLPGSRGAINCQLRHVSLEDEPHYEALSYYWGTTTQQVKIFVDGLSFFVTQNLHAALWRLRNANHPKTLWVDAICINQSDILEKNIQVALMRIIYRSCHCALVWLGEHDSYTKVAFQAIEFMASTYGGENYNYYDWRQIERSERPSFRFPLWSRLLSRPERLLSALAFNSLFTRPWFTRVWVIQEIALSPKAIVLCGAYQILWDLVEKASAMSRTNFEVQNHLGTILRFRNWPSNFADDVFCHMITAWHKDSTNPRDKIYGFLGLESIQNDDVPVEIDYAEDVNRTFIRFTKTYLSQTGNLQVLAISRGCKTTGSSDLPSWVIDYNYDRNKEPLPDQLISWTYEDRDGSVGSLNAGGTRFPSDTIASISMENEPAPARTGASSFAGLIAAWMSGVTFCRFYLEAKIMAENATPDGLYSPTGQSRLEAFWHIIYGHDPLKTYNATQIDERKDCEEFDSVLIRHVGRMSLGETSASIPLARIYLALVVLHGLLGQTSYLRFFGRIGITKQRRFFTTEKGYMGLGPRETRIGDKILILKGHQAPIVARDSEQWRVVGDSYIHGLMQGTLADVVWKMDNGVLDATFPDGLAPLIFGWIVAVYVEDLL
ncbi:hypothetical protein S7711_06833 [Stachybotrys chartarum IBT 7711]|uniref:Heterokaryon incompatibility domain-containing protein n=1 Tax=Stachybotrys chartarum (strain CBS 109288 / IBT 7711) TaxID=1280523 RepID=A0A084B784_STACB|nr:hypothetical protein S7711_06833 [Stachybotrys chartarum IBT 7711]